MHPSPGTALGSSNPVITSRYVVKSSDVLQDMRVNVFVEGSEEVIWYKERLLGDDEIIENLVHNPTSTICWTIHRPTHGWYIRIRSPGFPPGVFIPLIPVPQTAQYHTEAAMSFSSRTNIPGGVVQLTATATAVAAATEEEETPKSNNIPDEKGDSSSIDASSSSIHSYPPTPTAGSSSKRSSSSTLVSISQKPFRSALKPLIPTQITQFVLTPSSIPPMQQQQAPNASFLTRAFSMLMSHRPSYSRSFTLSRLLAPGLLSSPPPYVSNVPLVPEVDGVPPPLRPPLLVFHDRTPFLTVRSLTGLIEIDTKEERSLGVETSFWIAMALSYLEFLEERESYLAAISD